MLYGMDPYMPKNKRDLVATYFDEEIMEIPPAEGHVCNFERDFKIFWWVFKPSFDEADVYIFLSLFF